MERSSKFTPVSKIHNHLEFYMTYCDSKFFSFQNSFVVLTNTLNNTPKMDILIQTSIRILKKKSSLPSSNVPILIKSPFASFTHTVSILHKLMKVLPGHHKPRQKKFPFVLLSDIIIVLLEFLVFPYKFPFHIFFLRFAFNTFQSSKKVLAEYKYFNQVLHLVVGYIVACPCSFRLSGFRKKRHSW